jgi:hypothetical protein
MRSLVRNLLVSLDLGEKMQTATRFTLLSALMQVI